MYLFDVQPAHCRWLLIPVLWSGVLSGCALSSTQPAEQVTETPLLISPDAWQRRGRTFSYRDQTVFYQAAGQGETVLLLHGYPMSSWDFHKLWDDLSARYQVVAPDFLGYGFSSKPADYTYSVADHADMIEALMALRGLRNVKLIAHDIGVLVAEELVSRAQDRSLSFELESLIMLNATLFSSERRPTFIQGLSEGPLGGVVNNLASERSFVSNLTALTGSGTALQPIFAAQWTLLNYPDSSRIMHRLVHTVRDRRDNEQRWADDLCASPLPMRLIVGPDDPSSGLRLPESLRAYCDKAFSLVVLDGVGHFPHLEAPGRTLGAIASWQEGGY